jgi:hypothetical protein
MRRAYQFASKGLGLEPKVSLERVAAGAESVGGRDVTFSRANQESLASSGWNALITDEASAAHFPLDRSPECILYTWFKVQQPLQAQSR